MTGPRGSGKSSLAAHTVNYVSERGFIEGGSIYINCCGISDLQTLGTRLVAKMESDPSQWLDVLKKNEVGEGKLDRILEFLRKTDENFVFFFDNVDGMDDNHFSEWVEKLLDESPNIKVMVTSQEATNTWSKYQQNFRVDGL